jgi:asparagine synthase (glutamine-hydrolysing)
VGIIDGPIDTLYAKEVADFIGSEHYEYLFSKNEVIESVEDVIYHLESYDITTVRASIGMFLICKFVKKQTDIKVLLTGEVSDELFGYKYTDYAPSAVEFQAESEKRIRELYLYDVLRADRCISAHSLEARVPFSDKAFVKFIMQLNPEQKMNTYNMGKYLLRKAFECEQNYLPESILYREKAAFSDAVGHSMVDYLKEYAEQHYTDDNLVMARKKYKICPPHTKEALWYREIFEKFYPDRGDLIGSFWLPNQNWENCKVDDPSARELPNYGKSGE